jgi:hypothetical protein
MVQAFLSILYEKDNAEQIFMSFAPYFGKKKMLVLLLLTILSVFKVQYVV